MMKHTTYQFGLRVMEDEDRAEYAALVEAIRSLQPNGEVTGESVKRDLYVITIETVDVP